MRTVLEIPGEPPRKNERHKIVAPKRRRPFLANSREYDEFVLRLMQSLRLAGAQAICAGRWRITIESYWSRQRRLDVPGLAIGDVDAPLSAVLDGLEQCGAIDDDVRFVEVHAYKFHDRDNPRTVITIDAVREGRTKRRGV